MRVNILCYEPAGGWILYDYAEKLAASLRTYAKTVSISAAQAHGFDVTFHVNYWGLRQIQVAGLHSTMVTHIDTAEKFGLVRSQAEAGVWGFCMSEETSRRLNTLIGIERFASFAPPAMIAAERKKINVMIASRLYEDGRKNESWAIDFFRKMTPDSLTIRAMGFGWGSKLAELQGLGYEVDYIEQFERTSYFEMLRHSNYLLVTGNDEGALSTLDAILFGVIPIVTAQGYHLEQAGEVMLFSNHAQLMAIAIKIQEAVDRTNRLRDSMTNWDGFARKHYELWQNLVVSTSTAETAQHPSESVVQ
jgi:peroxiredoxin family protein